MKKQFLMLKLIYEFDARAREAVSNYAPLNDILSSKSKEKIGRAKYIKENDLAQFDDILKLMASEFKALGNEEDGDV